MPTPEEIAAAAAAGGDGEDDDSPDIDVTPTDEIENDIDNEDEEGDEEELDDDGEPVVKPAAVISQAEHVAALAEREATARQAVRDEIAAEASANEARRAEREARDAVVNAFPAAESLVIETLESAMVTSGEGARMTLGEALRGFTIPNARGRQVDALTLLADLVAQPYRELKDKAIDSGVAIASRQLEELASNLIPAEQRKAFIDKYDGAKLADYLRGLVEHAAPGTDFVKDLTLEAAEKLSLKLKAELAADRKGTNRAGRDQGRKDPPGDPKTTGGAGGATLSWQKLEQGYGDGTLTNAQEAEYRRQKTARETAGVR
jgi:hypothetical protein